MPNRSSSYLCYESQLPLQLNKTLPEVSIYLADEMEFGSNVSPKQERIEAHSLDVLPPDNYYPIITCSEYAIDDESQHSPYFNYEDFLSLNESTVSCSEQDSPKQTYHEDDQSLMLSKLYQDAFKMFDSSVNYERYYQMARRQIETTKSSPSVLYVHKIDTPGRDSIPAPLQLLF